MGAGGIGFDLTKFLTHNGESSSLNIEAFLKEWGVDKEQKRPGGLTEDDGQPLPPFREVTLLQRKTSKMGAGLGKTTGWIHRTVLKKKKIRVYPELPKHG